MGIDLSYPPPGSPPSPRTPFVCVPVNDPGNGRARFLEVGRRLVAPAFCQSAPIVTAVFPWKRPRGRRRIHAYLAGVINTRPAPAEPERAGRARIPRRAARRRQQIINSTTRNRAGTPADDARTTNDHRRTRTSAAAGIVITMHHHHPS